MAIITTPDPATLTSLANVGLASGITYYVSTTGVDTNTGRSVAQAFRTPERAYRLARPGDVVEILAGTYRPSVDRGFYFRAGGAAGAFCKIKAHGDGEVIFDSRGFSYGVYFFAGAPYWIIEGITIIGGSSYSMKVDARQIRVLSCDISGSSADTIKFVVGADDCVVYGCKLHSPASGTNRQGIDCTGGHRLWAARNEVYDIPDCGLQCKNNARNVVFEENYVHDMTGAGGRGIQVGQSTGAEWATDPPYEAYDCVIRNNTLRNIASAALTSASAYGTKIHGNDCRNASHSYQGTLYISNEAENGQANTNVEVYDNILQCGGSRFPIKVNSDGMSDFSTLTIRDNILWRPDGTVQISDRDVTKTLTQFQANRDIRAFNNRAVDPATLSPTLHNHVYQFSGGLTFNSVPNVVFTKVVKTGWHRYTGTGGLALAGQTSHSFNRAITTYADLAWTPPAFNTDGSTLNDLSQYNIYTGSAANALSLLRVLSAPRSSHRVTALAPGTHYFAISAVNAKGKESALSNVVSKTIAGKYVEYFDSADWSADITATEKLADSGTDKIGTFAGVEHRVAIKFSLIGVPSTATIHQAELLLQTTAVHGLTSTQDVLSYGVDGTADPQNDPPDLAFRNAASGTVYVSQNDVLTATGVGSRSIPLGGAAIDDIKAALLAGSTTFSLALKPSVAQTSVQEGDIGVTVGEYSNVTPPKLKLIYEVARTHAPNVGGSLVLTGTAPVSTQLRTRKTVSSSGGLLLGGASIYALKKTSYRYYTTGGIRLSSFSLYPFESKQAEYLERRMGELSIYNGTLLKLGAALLKNLDVETPAKTKLDAKYPGIRDALLRKHPWTFAITRKLLEKDPVTPLEAGNAYTLPQDCIRLLLPKKHCLDWKLEGRQILTSDSGPILVRYVRRVINPAEMDPLFIEALECSLAYELCEAITQSNAKQQLLAERLLAILAEAEKVNSIEKTEEEQLGEDSWEAARR